MTLPLPTTISPGDPGHIGDHEDIGLLFASFVAGDEVGGFKSGTFAARPAAGNFPRVYYATDIGQLYIDTGAAWAFVGGRFMGANVGLAAGFSLTENVVTTVVFDTEEYDTDSFHTNGATGNRLTVALAGYYRCIATVAITGADGVNEVILRKNGSQINAAQVPGFGGSTTVSVSTLEEVHMGAADYFDMGVRQTNSGTSAKTVGTGTMMTCALIRGD